MILLDFSQIIISNLFVNIGTINTYLKTDTSENQKPAPGKPGAKSVVNEDLIRHMVLNSLRYYHMKFGEKYGKIIICCDSKNYWRKDIFPYYKSGRKKNRDNSALDWHLIFESLNKLREEISLYLPYRVLHIDRTEADDVIAVVAKREFKAEKVLILSGDKDFIQLQKYPNIEQFAPIQKKFIHSDDAVEMLREHIMLGDSGDGVPNFLSPDDTFVSGKRQVSICRKKLVRWVKEIDPKNFCDTKMLRGYKRNQALIDLDFIPMEIQQTIIDEYEKPFIESRKQLLNYFVKFKLVQLMDKIQEF